MISRSINASQIRLASDIANEFFPNIKGDSYRDDASWLATMRALLPSRLGADVTAQVRLIEKESPSKKSRAQRMEYYLGGVDLTTPNTITVVNIRKTTEDMEKVLDAFRHNGVPDHNFAEAIFRRFYDQEPKGYVMVFVNDDIANSVVVTTSLSMHMWHTLTAFIRTYFAKAFAEKPVTDKEMQLIRALASTNRDDNSTDTYLQLMEEFAEPYDFRSAIIKQSLGNFTRKTKMARIRNAENAISNANSQIDRHRKEIAKQFAAREKAQIELMGLQIAADQDDASQELANYFLVNKSLVFTGHNDGYFNYWVKSYLTYWDERTAESYIRTHSGYLYAGANDYNLDIGKFEKLLRAIFIERSVKVLMTAAYQFVFNDNEITININRGDSQPPEVTGYMLNPHSMHNSCWGTGHDNLMEALNNGDYTGAVGVTIYAGSEMNIADVSTKQFSRWLAESKWNCIELPDGTRMTCKEYLDTL